MSSSKVLNYVLNRPRTDITLDLFEAERYAAAVVVQSLVGTLVYYSNKGEYEPRLAESWERTSPMSWKITLKKGLNCENGEEITPRSFAASLGRMIWSISQRNPIPVLRKLKGYDEFIREEEEGLKGLSFDEAHLYFEFETPVRSGFLEVLSFSPFGYISTENLTEDFKAWKDPSKFISSGPYQLDLFEMGKRIALKRNPKWTLPFEESAPDQIEFTFEIPKDRQTGHWIVDSALGDLRPPTWLKSFNLVPEYLNAILLGNLSKGYFSRAENRSAFKEHIDQARLNLPKNFGSHFRSNSFYLKLEETNKPAKTILKRPTKNSTSLIIEGRPPADGTSRFYAWQVLKSALERAHLSYEFNDNESSFEQISNQSFDLRMGSTSIGHGVEPWGIEIIFCSDLGIKLPDPSKRIASLVNQFENGAMDLEEFKKIFFNQIREDSAILPISHFGVQLFLSDSIYRKSLSPRLSIIRFDQLGLVDMRTS